MANKDESSFWMIVAIALGIWCYSLHSDLEEAQKMATHVQYWSSDAVMYIDAVKDNKSANGCTSFGADMRNCELERARDRHQH